MRVTEAASRLLPGLPLTTPHPLDQPMPQLNFKLQIILQLIDFSVVQRAVLV